MCQELLRTPLYYNFTDSQIIFYCLDQWKGECCYKKKKMITLCNWHLLLQSSLNDSSNIRKHFTNLSIEWTWTEFDYLQRSVERSLNNSADTNHILQSNLLKSAVYGSISLASSVQAIWKKKHKHNIFLCCLGKISKMQQNHNPMQRKQNWTHFAHFKSTIRQYFPSWLEISNIWKSWLLYILEFLWSSYYTEK